MARKPASGTRERILDAAAGLFDRLGVHAVRVRQIIDEIGCGKQSLYREGMAPNPRGCPLRNTYAEFPDPGHPAHQTALKHFQDVREQLRDLARRIPAADPDRLGDRIMLIIDGLCISGSTLGSTGVAATAVGPTRPGTNSSHRTRSLSAFPFAIPFFGVPLCTPAFRFSRSITVKTIVVTGGTSGIGQALAHTFLDRGEQVVVLGPDPLKGKKFLDTAHRSGAADRAFFIASDLSLVSENRRVIDEIKARFTAVDALVLCARYFRSHRAVTPEGFEHNFALYYLSRYLLGHGLADQMNKADAPVVVNIAGPGVGAEGIQWDDLGLEHGYDGWTAMFQGGRLNDLLGVAYADEKNGHRARYVLLFPGGTRTGFAGQFDPATALYVEQMKQAAQPVERTVPPIVEIMENPPREPLSAFAEGMRLSLLRPAFDRGSADRLDRITRELLRKKTGVR